MTTTKGITKPTTKRGAASLFVVIFTMILLGVVTLGFTRIMLSEANQSTNNDLSQSAYDSALAGIEDAKVAILKYHDCISKGYNRGSVGSDEALTCAGVISSMQDGIKDQSCDIVSNTLGRETVVDGQISNGGGEVVIQETQSSMDSGDAVSSSQAYTCVTIQENLSDYRTTLSDTKRFRVIPIRTTDINALSDLEVSWFSTANAEALGSDVNYHEVNNALANQKFKPFNEVQKTIPVLSLQFFQTNETFDLSELSTSKSDSNTNHVTLYFRPVASGQEGKKEIATTDVSRTGDKNSNNVFDVECEPSAEFYCSVKIGVPQPWNTGNRNSSTALLIVELPYGQPEADVSISLKAGEKTLPFIGAQSRIDSTGRANDLYRRVESRVDLTDYYFPYPEFAIQMTGDSEESSISKNFYVTNNCWYTIKEGDTYKNVSCDDYGPRD